MAENREKNRDAVDDLLDEILRETETEDPAPMLSEETEPEAEPYEEAAEEAPVSKAAAAHEDHSEAADSYDDEYDDDDYDDDYDDYEEERRRRAKKRAASARRRKNRRKKSRGISCSLLALTIIFSVSILLSAAILAVAMELFGINKSMVEKPVTIPKGATTADIAELLEEEGIIRLPKLFLVMSRLNNADALYIAGEHVVSPAMGYEAIIEELCDDAVNKRETVTVTFREGINLLDAAQLLEENEVCNAKDFIFYFNAGGYGFEFESLVPQTSELKFYRMEGYLFPDTYDFYVGEDPEIVVQKIYENFERKLTQDDLERMDELGLTLDEMITLASIVQAEAPVASSMQMVSSVFHNRLNNSSIFPLLQSDPTRVYAEDVIEPNLDIANRLMCDAYNTYVGAGLPPGAINNPGRDAIDAVLYPAESDYYFFCANVQTGEIFYAKTNAEHEENLAEIKRQQEEGALAGDGNNTEE
ncbi:MAG: endolytic transglycosylase MltG [Oscillospiraceae bacterium]|nr:endolytic transglycosylase MltG [Oscillospiraceae bacterium]